MAARILLGHQGSVTQKRACNCLAHLAQSSRNPFRFRRGADTLRSLVGSRLTRPNAGRGQRKPPSQLSAKSSSKKEEKSLVPAPPTAACRDRKMKRSAEHVGRAMPHKRTFGARPVRRSEATQRVA